MTSYAQAGQDLFAFTASGGKTDGTFLDIGCNDATFHSNSYGLEVIGWRGLLVDIGAFASGRRVSPFVQADASHAIPEVEAFLRERAGFVDYLSLDVDDAQIPALHALPWDWCRFGAITIEHDKYRIGPDVQNHIRQFLLDRGYKLAEGDVSAPGYGVFEDWFIYPPTV